MTRRIGDQIPIGPIERFAAGNPGRRRSELESAPLDDCA
jgi:hypothetical protein